MSSSVEERLARDIAALMGGVVVSETDLREARIGVDERIESRRRRDRVRTVAVAAAAAVVLGVGVTAFLTLGGDDDTARQFANPGPSANDPHKDYLTGVAPTAALVSGVWRLDNGETAVKFNDDGTVRFDDQGALFSQPGTVGTYAIDGDRITVTIKQHDESRCIGTTFAVRASFPEAGNMRFVPSGTSTTCAALPSGQGALEKVLPASSGILELRPSEDRGWQPLTNKAFLHGLWAAEGGGHVLEMAPSGSYYVVDDSGEPIDRGGWSWRGSALTLTSSAESAKCSAGDQVVLRAVQWLDPGTRAIRGTLQKNACGGAWTPATWFLVPHEGSDGTSG